MSLVQVQLEEPNLKACSLSRLFSFLLFFFFRMLIRMSLVQVQLEEPYLRARSLSGLFRLCHPVISVCLFLFFMTD